MIIVNEANRIKENIVVEEILMGTFSGLGYGLLCSPVPGTVLAGTVLLLISGQIKALVGLDEIGGFLKRIFKGEANLKLDLANFMSVTTFIVTQVDQWTSVIPFLAKEIPTAASFFCINTLPGIISSICLPAYLLIFSWTSYSFYDGALKDQIKLDKFKTQINENPDSNDNNDKISEYINLKQELIDNKFNFAMMSAGILAAVGAATFIFFAPFSIPAVVTSAIVIGVSFFSAYMFGYFKKSKINKVANEVESLEIELGLNTDNVLIDTKEPNNRLN